jgi:hypothetical protein
MANGIMNLDDDSITVERGGVKYNLTLPSFKDLKWLRDETKGREAEDMAELYIEFLARLGMPKEVSESLPASTLIKLSTSMLNPDSLKKN